LEILEHDSFDVIFLDENMPGKSGLETLSDIKEVYPALPVVMITKSEEEQIMEEAIGSKIADYLIKPLNPNQILLSAKKLLENERIISEKTNLSYQQEFAKLSMLLSEVQDHEDWASLYRKLVYWELQIDQTEDKSMAEIFDMQKTEANQQFTKYIKKHYRDWIRGDESKPALSNDIMKEKVFPLLEQKPVVFILIDNLRFDQWEVIEGDILKFYELETKEHYYSILPTTTAYARNSLFAGKLPLEISKENPQYWSGEHEQGPKNKFERELLAAQISDQNKDLKFSYHKIITAKEGKNLSEKADDLMTNDLNVLVYNFVDMLSHARTDMQMIRELAPNESAYRALTRTWFNHSSLLDTLKALQKHDIKVVITTDHGTIRVNKPEKIIGDKNTNTNLRYKQGKNLAFEESNVFFSRVPEEIGLPKPNVSTTFVFATDDSFLTYPNNYNHYVNYYKDTFQHGGISLEEVIVPFIVLNPK
jgi:CheY-like chemotaxis protein